jgi:hypothetical protein
MDLLGKKAPNRKMSLGQAYSALHYEDRIKDIIPGRWVAERQRLIDEKGKDYGATAPVWYRNFVAKELYDDESDGVKEEVEKFRTATMSGQIDEDIEAVDNGDGEDADEEQKNRLAKARGYQK